MLPAVQRASAHPTGIRALPSAPVTVSSNVQRSLPINTNVTTVSNPVTIPPVTTTPTGGLTNTGPALSNRNPPAVPPRNVVSTARVQPSLPTSVPTSQPATLAPTGGSGGTGVSPPLSQAALARQALTQKMNESQQVVVSSVKTFETGADPEKLYEAALEQLGIKASELSYATGLALRDTQFTTVDLDAAYKAAWTYIYPLGFKGSKKRTIVDDGVLSIKDPLMVESGRCELLLITILKKHGVTDPTDPRYWFVKGQILFNHPEIPLRCDGCAALVFYLLYHWMPAVNIAVIGQGKKSALAQEIGHWFIVLGAYSRLEPVVVLSKQSLNPQCVMVDLWGANLPSRASPNSVVMPTPAPLFSMGSSNDYGDNLRVFCKI